MKHVAVVGLGYVGLPLSVLAAEKGKKVIGFDIDDQKIGLLQQQKSYIEDVPAKKLRDTDITFTSDASKIGVAEAVFICVPTPVKNKKPDLKPVESAIRSIAPYLRPKTLVVLESTVNPGVCNQIVIPLLESLTGMHVGKDLYLAHCPERINPGDKKWKLNNINRVVGANSEKELKLAVDLYEELLDAEVKPMGSLKEAEAVKIVENSFRDINIAFVNELAMSFHKLGINLENVIDGATTKPFSFMAHRPGAGVGGHCIPVDPYYLIEYANDLGFDHKFLRLARSINDGMPSFTVELLEEAFSKIKLPVKKSKIALLGLSYKADVGDDRESPSYEIKNLLEERGVNLVVYDPYIPGKSTVKSLEEALEYADALVIATAHKEFANKLNTRNLKKHKVKVIVDGRDLFRDKQQALKRSGIYYVGIGC